MGVIKYKQNRWVGGVGILVAEKMQKNANSCFFFRYGLHIQDFQELIRGISMVLRHASFSNFVTITFFEITISKSYVCNSLVSL